MINPSLKYLNRIARAAAKQNGHTLSRFKVANSGNYAKAQCRICGFQMWTSAPHDGPPDINWSGINQICTSKT